MIIRFFILALFFYVYSSPGIAENQTSLVRFYNEVDILRRLAESDPQDAISRIDQYRNDISTYPPLAKVDYYSVYGTAYMHMRDYGNAKAMIEKGLDIYQMGDISESSFYLMVIRGKIGEALGEKGAIDFFDAATQMAIGLGRNDLLANAYIDMVSFYAHFLQFVNAYDYLNKAYSLIDETKESISLAKLHYYKSLVLKHVQRPEDAMTYAQKSRNIFESFQRFGELHQADLLVAQIYEDMGQLQDAEEIVRMQIDESRALDLPILGARSKMHLIENLIMQNRPEESLLLLDEIQSLVIDELILGRTDRFLLAKVRALVMTERINEAKSLFTDIQNGLHFDLNTQGTISKIKQGELHYELLMIDNEIQKAFYALQDVVSLQIMYEQSRSQQSLQEVIVRDDTLRMAKENELLEYNNEKQRLELTVKDEQNNRRNWMIAAIVIISAVIAGIIVLQFITHTKLNRMAKFDSLTQVANRRMLMTKGDDLWQPKSETTLLASAWSSSVDADNLQDISSAIVIIDIDHFKTINDQYGHQTGDNVLKVVAKMGNAILGQHLNTFGRLGGEEFLSLIPNTTNDNLTLLIDKFVNALSQYAWQDLGLDKPITVSIGFATKSQFPDASFDEVLNQADVAMYKSKRNGRARTTPAQAA